jgi:hypothetical protein
MDKVFEQVLIFRCDRCASGRMKRRENSCTNFRETPDLLLGNLDARVTVCSVGVTDTNVTGGYIDRLLRPGRRVLTFAGRCHSQSIDPDQDRARKPICMNSLRIARIVFEAKPDPNCRSDRPVAT